MEGSPKASPVPGLLELVTWQSCDVSLWEISAKPSAKKGILLSVLMANQLDLMPNLNQVPLILYEVVQ